MTLSVPLRAGERPRTAYEIPHRQIGDNPGPELYARMAARFLAAPGTTVGQSLISVPGARALFLEGRGPDNPDVFFEGREFAHIHPGDDGSFHMMLSFADAAHVVEQRWGELHPYAASGRLPPNVVMVYAPRDDGEIDIIAGIAEASRRHAVSHGETAPCACRMKGETT